MKHSISLKNEIKAIYKNLSLRKRLILLFVLIALLPFMILMNIFFLRSRDVLTQNTLDLTIKSLRQGELSITNRIENMIHSMDVLVYDQELNDMLHSTSMDLLDQLEEEYSIRMKIARCESTNNIIRARIYLNDEKIYSSNGINLYGISSIVDEVWFDDLYKNYQPIVWRHFKTIINNRVSDVITAIKLVRNRNDFETPQAVFMVDIYEDTISLILSNISMNPQDKNEVLLVDSSGTVISSLDKSLLGTKGLSQEEMEIVKSYDGGATKLAGEDKYLISKKIKDIDWYIVDKLSMSAIIRSNRSLYKILGFSTAAIMMVLFLGLVFITILLISGAIEKDLKSIIKMIEQESVDSVIANPDDNRNSIIKLKSNVSMMLFKIKSLVAESYDAKVREREAELKALQSMINPHFLYNTLESINWMAYKYNAGEISSMVTLLAKYFRLSLNKGKDIVALSDEFSLSSTYLDIQKARFSDSFEYNLELDSRVSGFEIPKLILQPVIENALLHGIQKNRGVKGKLSIRGYEEDDFVIIEIRDNGIGMTPEQIEGIMSDYGKRERNSYGIYNVLERIKLFFPEGSRLTISSELKNGTTARYYLRKRS